VASRESAKCCVAAPGEADAQGLMTARHASLNDLPIREEDRKFRWPLGRRPDDHTGLSSFGF